MSQGLPNPGEGFTHELAYPLVSMSATERVEWLCMMLNLRLAAGVENMERDDDASVLPSAPGQSPGLKG